MRKEDSAKKFAESNIISITMLPRINKILNSEQLKAVLQLLFKSRPVKIIRIIAATGRSQVTWIHIENALNHRRMASFLSFEDLIKNFWSWLLQLEMFALAAWASVRFNRDIARLRECVWNLVQIGDRIISKDNHNSGVVMEKKITSEKTKVLIIDWGQVIFSEDPAYVTII